ncbi:hypothetical protein [Tautonia sociabilis]|uniref:hypothetical protein n=1 Tax=Tautonia sociabilis TaxID=2080755 RepID=UPI0013150BAB|nr:hypothetical protein [Tautonia sociabilis]
MVRLIAITVVTTPIAAARAQDAPMGEAPDRQQQQQPEEFYPEDPAIELANAASARIAREERELDSLMEAFLDAVDATPPGAFDPEKEAMTADLMRRVARGMVAQGRQIIDHWEEMTAQAEQLEKSLDSAPARFRAAAEVYRGYAEAEEFEDLSALYLDTAQMFEGKARLAEQEQQSLGALTDDDLVKYIRHVTRYYERIIPALEYADDLTAATRYDAFVERLRNFKERHQQLEEAVRTLRDKALGENAFDEGIREKHKAEEAAVRAAAAPAVRPGTRTAPERADQIGASNPHFARLGLAFEEEFDFDRLDLVAEEESNLDLPPHEWDAEEEFNFDLPPVDGYVVEQTAQDRHRIRREQAASYTREQGRRPAPRLPSREQAP